MLCLQSFAELHASTGQSLSPDVSPEFVYGTYLHLCLCLLVASLVDPLKLKP